MTRLEKCQMAKRKGFHYDEITGFITTPTGVLANKISTNGYLMLTVRENGITAYLYGHQFAWFWKYNEVVDLIDHRNQIKTDNRICNLRSITKQQNSFNTKAKGSSLDSRNKKFSSSIVIDGKKKFLGYFDNEESAQEAYAKAKTKYHLIN